MIERLLFVEGVFLCLNVRRRATRSLDDFAIYSRLIFNPVCSYCVEPLWNSNLQETL